MDLSFGLFWLFLLYQIILNTIPAFFAWDGHCKKWSKDSWEKLKKPQSNKKEDKGINGTGEKKKRRRCLLASSLFLESVYGSCKIHWTCWNLGWPFKTALLVFTAELLLSLIELLKLLGYWKYSGSPAQSKGNKAPEKVEENRFILFYFIYFLMRMFSFMMTDIPSAGAVSPHATNEDLMQRANHGTLVSWRQTSACTVCKLANTRKNLEKRSFGVCVCVKKFPNSMFAAARAQPCFAYAALGEAEHPLILLVALGIEDAQCFPGERPVWFSW